MRPPSGDAAMRAFVGATLCGRYRLLEHLGSGAFGSVFLSDQYVLGVPMRRVALKLSRRTRLSDEDAREVLADALLLAEAMDSITDARSRQHLVHVYDAGITPGAEARGYLAMELVRGSTLEDQFASLAKTPSPLLMKWIGQVCLALRGLHSLDPPILHRDLKPSNVLLGADNTVRLVDFGLSAKMLHLGYAPGVAGTLAYMAPETSRGRSTPASDVYSVGLLTYEGLTGRHPFRGLVPPVELPDALYPDWLHEAKRQYRPLPPSALNNTVSSALDAIVLRCLEFEADDRFAGAAELLVALDARELPSRPADQATSLPKEDHFLLLRDQGEAFAAAGRHERAAGAFAEAWGLTANAVILRTTHERAALLQRAADCYRLAGNTFQARRYDALRAKELGDGR
ncbi:serine/threonine-protein kinase [Amycolatopsis sp. NPDC024027]|uniref:serine/threonine-protein kinase n=1 Tax=Amycolatopsis sp. NPDC024027 TaxID=3154327 RepID=UPI0033C36071